MATRTFEFLAQRESPSSQRSGQRPLPTTPQARPQHSSLGALSACPSGSHPAAPSAPSSQWITSPMTWNPNALRGSREAVELCSTYQVPWRSPLTFLNPVSSSERDRWSCPLHRSLSTQPVGTLVIASPPSVPCWAALEPFLLYKDARLHLHILPLLPGPGMGTFIPPSCSSACLPLGYPQQLSADKELNSKPGRGGAGVRERRPPGREKELREGPQGQGTQACWSWGWAPGPLPLPTPSVGPCDPLMGL